MKRKARAEIKLEGKKVARKATMETFLKKTKESTEHVCADIPNKETGQISTHKDILSYCMMYRERREDWF